MNYTFQNQQTIINFVNLLSKNELNYVYVE